MYTSIIIFSTQPEYDFKGNPTYSYLGGNRKQFVRGFNNEQGVTDVVYTEEDAMHFKDDAKCTECMEWIVANKNPFQIAVWEYKNGKLLSQCVHYPNKNWGKNNNLQPSLMYISVSEYYKNKGIY